jgi:CheY-like chemotaxis protein/HPt (histidine-containing phosphotransfer) domain-containing protein
MSWDDQINEVRHQISELQNALDQNDDQVKSNKQSIQQARFQVEALLNQPYNAREALFELPLVLHALTNNKLVGTLLFGPDGRVVMHNGTVQRSLGLDPMTNRFPEAIFRDADSGAPISERNLPWARCLRGEIIPPSMHLSMERSDEIVCFEVKTIALRKGNEVSGAVALFMDLTDSFRADLYIKRLCVQLEQHLTTIETARRELRFLTDKLGEPSGEAQAKQEVPVEPPRVKTHRVLVADDIPVNQKLLIMQLRKFGIEAETADNGLDAADFCRTTQFAMIFMDVDMPIMNGFEATQRIRALEKNTGRRTPIVALTSYNRIGDREKCLESGMDDYLAKGSALTRLREIVDQYIFSKQDATPAGEEQPVDEPAAESNDEQTDLSLELIERRLGEEAEEILALFLGSAMMLLHCLEYAINEKDARSVNHFAYSIKGPCASIGLHNLALISADLTYAAEMGRWVTARDYFNVLNEHFRALKEQWSMKHEQEAIANPQVANPCS